MSQTFKHLLHCTDCDDQYFVLVRREDQPPFCPMCGGQEVVDATEQAAAPASDEGDEE